MVIAPNTTIWLLKDVPLDDTYDHTLFWQADVEHGITARQAQHDWFLGQANGFVKYAKQNLTYQRVEKGECMVEVNNASESIYDCNYLVFINASYENKCFYCFLQDVEYVNNRTYRVRFKVDVMQTFFFDYDLIPCFIERQHTATDVFGENIQEEKVEYGEYWYDSLDHINLGENYIVVCGTVRPVSGATHDFTEQDIEVYGGGGTYNGIYSGVLFNVFRYPVTVNEFLTAVTKANLSEGIVNIFMAPARFFDATQKPIDYYRFEDRYIEPGTFTGLWGDFGYSAGTVKVSATQLPIRGVTLPTQIGTYTPRNKKLLCYPYSMLTVTNNNGKAANYRYEFFTPAGENANICKLNCVLALSSTPEACIYPQDYKRVPENYLEKIVIDDFPQCSYTIDSYRAWIAQHKYQLIAGFTSDVVNVGVAALTGGVGVGAGLGAFNSAFSKMAQIKQASTLPPHAKGEQTNTMMMALEAQGFHLYHTRITDYYAELLDRYFDRFGYVSNRIGIPNRNVRKHFTYCKTANCDINANGMPDKYVKEIKSVYDNGIAFWCDTAKANVGKYTLAICTDNQAPHVRPAPAQNNG